MISQAFILNLKSQWNGINGGGGDGGANGGQGGGGCGQGGGGGDGSGDVISVRGKTPSARVARHTRVAGYGQEGWGTIGARCVGWEDRWEGILVVDPLDYK